MANNDDACPVQGLHTQDAYVADGQAVRRPERERVYRGEKEYLKFNVYSVLHVFSGR